MTFAEVKKQCAKSSSVEDRVITLVMWRKVSVYLSFLLLRLGVAPDWITLASLLFVLLGGLLFLMGQPLWGAISFAAFQLFDCSDGEVARCLGPSKYGSHLDAFGADLIYAIGPVSAGYYLFDSGVLVLGLQPAHFLAAGVGISISFLLYRLIKIRLSAVRNMMTGQQGPLGPTSEPDGGVQVVRSNGSLFDRIRSLHPYWTEVFRANFFAQPGMIVIFLIAIALDSPESLAIYLVIFLAFNISYLLAGTFRAYWVFTHPGR